MFPSSGKTAVPPYVSVASFIQGDALIQKKISVVMPAYNEAGHIVRNVVETVETLQSFGYNFEVIVVDDGSADSTHVVAMQAHAAAPDHVRVIRYDENRGKGHALLCGASCANGDLIAFLDADMDLHPKQLPAFLAIMEANDADVVVGSKLHPASNVNYPRIRKMLSYGYYLIVLALFGLPIRDTQTGLKIFKRDVLEKIAPLSRMEHFAFDVELLTWAHLFGFRLIDAPVTLHFQRAFSRVRLRDIFVVFRDTMRIFVRLRLLAPVIKEIVGIGVRPRLLGVEQRLPSYLPHAMNLNVEIAESRISLVESA